MSTIKLSKEAKAAVKRAGDYERWLEKRSVPLPPDYEHEDKLSAKEMYDDDKSLEGEHWGGDWLECKI